MGHTQSGGAGQRVREAPSSEPISPASAQDAGDESATVVQLPTPTPMPSAEYAVPPIPPTPTFPGDRRDGGAPGGDSAGDEADGRGAASEDSAPARARGDSGRARRANADSGRSRRAGPDSDRSPDATSDIDAPPASSRETDLASASGSATRVPPEGDRRDPDEVDRGAAEAGQVDDSDQAEARHDAELGLQEAEGSGAERFPEPPARAGDESAPDHDGLPAPAEVQEPVAAVAPEAAPRPPAAAEPDDAEETAAEVRFGELARLEGFATSEQVSEALRIQRKLHLGGRRRKIGKIMVKLGLMTATQAKYLLRLQRSRDPIAGYKLLERRGQGGMGVVYRAVQKSLKREVALKILAPRYAQEERFLKRFFQEAKLSAEMNHPNVVSAIDFGDSNGYYYYAMEYVDGWSVSEMLKEDGPFDPEEALDIVVQIAQALEHAAQKHIVHRDIKPENILITPNGVAKLTDLGLSKQLTSDCSLTAEGRTLGTPFYVSPELARGTRNVDTRSDIYSLGATLYHMLAGDPPFVGDNAAAIMARHIADEPRPLRKVASHVPRTVQRLVQRMMAKRPDDRYQTAGELASDIEEILQGRNPFPSAGRPGGEHPSGRHHAIKRPKSGPRRAYTGDARDRRTHARGRPAPAPRGPGRTGVLIAASIVGLLAIGGAVAVRVLGGGSGGDRPHEEAEETLPAGERSHRAAARLATQTPQIQRLVSRGLYSQALKEARALTGYAKGTPTERRARELLEEVEAQALRAVRVLLRSAEDALQNDKPDLALDHLQDLPPVEDREARARADRIRTQAERQLGRADR